MITGENGSGKSVFLKQTGLIAFLAQCGSFVPAENATISLFDKIQSKFSIPESTSLNKSFFELELTEISRVINQASTRSLILIDEFGRGTHYLDGLSLFYGFWTSMSFKS